MESLRSRLSATNTKLTFAILSPMGPVPAGRIAKCRSLASSRKVTIEVWATSAAQNCNGYPGSQTLPHTVSISGSKPHLREPESGYSATKRTRRETRMLDVNP